MRWRVPAGAFFALALLIPAAPAVAQAGSSEPGSAVRQSEASCPAVEYVDLRERVTIDLDAASDLDVRILANQVMASAVANSLTMLPRRMQEQLDGTADGLRAFLKTTLWWVWSVDLRISVNQAMAKGGPNVKETAQEVLDAGTVDAYLSFLNHGLCVARALD